MYSKIEENEVKVLEQISAVGAQGAPYVMGFPADSDILAEQSALVVLLYIRGYVSAEPTYALFGQVNGLSLGLTPEGQVFLEHRRKCACEQASKK